MIVLAILAGLAITTHERAAGAPAIDSRLNTLEDQLAEKYAPILFLKAQQHECDRNGEAFVPAPVGVLLGDPAVAMRGPDGAVLKMAPTAVDLATAEAETYLDLPGNPRDPGCDFERAFLARMSDLQPTAYAHITVDERVGKLVLQYWFFYYFNDFNNTHEGDWEMVQLIFDTVSVESALGSAPSEIGYSQHGGGELALWDDEKVKKEGTHPYVYVAAGSHGAYFGSHTYIGWGQNGTGLGCDDTVGPSRRTDLDIVLLPNQPEIDGPFGWLLFEGRWGERQPWEFNGPTGPFGKEKWLDPIGVMDGWRSFSLSLPESRTLGPTATDLFCSLSTAGSALLIQAGVRPWVVILGVAAVALVFFVMLVRTRGLMLAAVRTYRQNFGVFLRIGLIAIPIGWVFNGFAVLLAENPPVEWALQWFTDSAVTRLAFAGLVGLNQQALTLVVMTPAVVRTMADITRGQAPSARRSYREAVAFLPLLVLAGLWFVAGVGGLILLVLTAPLAILLGLRWQFFGQAVIIDGASSVRSAMTMSRVAVRGHMAFVFAATLVIQSVSVLPGPLLGLILLIPGGASVQLANGVSSFVYVVTIPIATIALTILYSQLKEGALALEADPATTASG